MVEKVADYELKEIPDRVPANPDESDFSGDRTVRSQWFIVLVGMVGVVGGFLFGFDTAVISGTVEMVKELYHLSGAGVGWFTSVALIGCIMGTIMAGKIADQYGRRPVLVISASLFLLSSLACMFAPNYGLLVFARWVGGIGVGLASVVEPLYISEFAPARIRGRLVAMYQLAIVTGILAAYYSNYLLLKISLGAATGGAAEGIWHRIFVTEVWRAMLGAAILPASVFMLLRFLMPESPRWLIKAGQEKAGLDILAKIDGAQLALKELAAIKATLGAKKESFSMLFRPGLRRALLVGVGLSFFGQLTGVNIVVYYGPSILHQAGVDLGGTLQFQVLLGIINLVFTVLAMRFIDRVGRRPLLIGGMVPITISLAAAAVLFLLKSASPLLLVAILGLYMACQAFSVCAVIWVLTPEIFPNSVRARGMSIATLTNWAMNAFAAGFFPWYVAKYGMHVGFFTFAGASLLFTFFVIKFIPETKGKSLEEIEDLWQAPSAT